MRQLQQVYLNKKDAPEAEAVKGGVELQPMPPVTSDSAVEFADWLYMAEQTIGGLTDSAAWWFSETLKGARKAYEQCQLATPMERLVVRPHKSPELSEDKWNRLERRVLTLLLAAMPSVAKEDAVTHRVSSAAAALFRLHVLYQPGGASERATILKQLEGTSAGVDPNDAVTQLRKWCRYLERAEESGITAPDSSVLLRGVECIIQKAVDKNHEVKLRLSLAKIELQLQGRPTRVALMKFVNHALAELQQISPGRTRNLSSGGDPRLKAMNTSQAGGEATSPGSPSGPSPKSRSSTSTKTPCKFFASDAGCRRGTSCQYGHEFASKEEKRNRCWFCGSKQHRQSECPAKESLKTNKNPKAKAAALLAAPTGSSTSSTTTGDNVGQLEHHGSQPATSSGLNVESSSSTMPAPSSATSTSSDPDLKALLQEANAMLKKMNKLSMLKLTSFEEVKKELDERGMLEGEMALLDSGASHVFRLGSEFELKDAVDVCVQLADGKVIVLKQNKAGTLMPRSLDAGEKIPTTILPIGELVDCLGCSLQWTKRNGLVVEHPEHGVLATQVSGNCPMIGETQALQLIQELEERKLEQLRGHVKEGVFRIAGQLIPRCFEGYMSDYVQSGHRADGLRALQREDSALGTLSEAHMCSLVEDINLDAHAGHRYLKALPFKRSQRKRMMRTKWIVHLFSGDKRRQVDEFKVLESEDVMVVNVDLSRSKLHNMAGISPMYQALLWAAATGRIEAVLGEPPAGPKNEELALRQLFLWMVAKYGNEVCGVKAPAFLLQSRAGNPLWLSAYWEAFQDKEYAMTKYFNDHREVCGTNLVLEIPGDEWHIITAEAAGVTWTLDFKKSIVTGLRCHKRRGLLCRIDGPLCNMSEKELGRWTQHVRSNHFPYHRRCKTCVTARGTGKAHRSVRSPSAFTLSLDVAGPFRVCGENADGSKYRYILAGSYVFPKGVSMDAKDEKEPHEDKDDGAGVLVDGGPDVELYQEERDWVVNYKEGEDLEIDELVKELETLFEEELEKEVPPDAEDQQKMAEHNAEYQRLCTEVGEDNLEYEVLRYAIPMSSRRTSEVNMCVRQMFLQVRADGYPIVRCHSDRARELRNWRLRVAVGKRSIAHYRGSTITPVQWQGRSNGQVPQIPSSPSADSIKVASFVLAVHDGVCRLQAKEAGAWASQ